MYLVGVSAEYGCHDGSPGFGPIPCAYAGPGRSMMDADGSPLDAATIAVRVARVIRELDRRNDEEGDILLSDLLRAAWPTCQAQQQ